MMATARHIEKLFITVAYSIGRHLPYRELQMCHDRKRKRERNRECGGRESKRERERSERGRWEMNIKNSVLPQ